MMLQVTSDDNASHGSREEASGACGGPLAPLCDPAWFQQYQRMDAFNRQMVRYPKKQRLLLLLLLCRVFSFIRNTTTA